MQLGATAAYEMDNGISIIANYAQDDGEAKLNADDDSGVLDLKGSEFSLSARLSF